MTCNHPIPLAPRTKNNTATASTIQTTDQPSNKTPQSLRIPSKTAMRKKATMRAMEKTPLKLNIVLYLSRPKSFVKGH